MKPAIIRIPGSGYEGFITELENESNGKLLYKEINARDVTEEYLDIETRLANKRVYLARYQELVKRATTVKEVLEIEEQIRALEEEIESAEGRLRYLSDHGSYSTLTLKLSQEIAYAPIGKESSCHRLKLHSHRLEDYRGDILCDYQVMARMGYLGRTVCPLLPQETS